MARNTTRIHNAERYPGTGRIKPRKKEPELGNVAAARRAAMFGASPETWDQAGRAFANGLLGDDAKDKLDFARKDCERYWRVYDQFRGGDSVARLEHGRGQRMPRRLSQEKGDAKANSEDVWRTQKLRDADAAVKAITDAKGPYFDLVRSRDHADQGPGWLDRIILAKRGGRQPRPGDIQQLCLAVQALSAAMEAVNRKQVA